MLPRAYEPWLFRHRASEEQLRADIGFLTEFTLEMADAVKCPVSREIPENVKTKLDEYLLRKRKKE